MYHRSATDPSSCCAKNTKRSYLLRQIPPRNVSDTVHTLSRERIRGWFMIPPNAPESPSEGPIFILGPCYAEIRRRQPPASRSKTPARRPPQESSSSASPSPLLFHNVGGPVAILISLAAHHRSGTASATIAQGRFRFHSARDPTKRSRIAH